MIRQYVLVVVTVVFANVCKAGFPWTSKVKKENAEYVHINLQTGSDRYKRSAGMPEELHFRFTMANTEVNVRLKRSVTMKESKHDVNADNSNSNFPLFVIENGTISREKLPLVQTVAVYHNDTMEQLFVVRRNQEMTEYLLEGVFHDASLGQYHVTPDRNGFHWIHKQDTIMDFRGDYIDNTVSVSNSKNSSTAGKRRRRHTRMGLLLGMSQDFLERRLRRRTVREDGVRGERSREREKRQALSHYEIELFMVSDFRDYAEWLSYYDGNRTQTAMEMHIYYSFIANWISQRYRSIGNVDPDLKIDILTTGLLIVKSPHDSYWTENNVQIFKADGRPYAEAGASLEAFRRWIDNRPASLPHSDHWMLFTGYDIYTDRNPHIAGLAKLGGLCTHNSVSIIEQDNTASVGATAAHELGHSLSARHDGELKDCRDEDNYIMSRKLKTPDVEKLASRPWQFSPCSVRAFRHFLSRMKCGQIERHGTPLLTTELEGGQVFSADLQCQLALGKYSFFGRRLQHVDHYQSMCRRLFCAVPWDPTAFQAIFAMEKTTCGDGKWCVQGKCTRDINAPRALDNCPQGDSPNVQCRAHYCRFYPLHYKNIFCCDTCRPQRAPLNNFIYSLANVPVQVEKVTRRVPALPGFEPPATTQSSAAAAPKTPTTTTTTSTTPSTLSISNSTSTSTAQQANTPTSTETATTLIPTAASSTKTTATTVLPPATETTTTTVALSGAGSAAAAVGSGTSQDAADHGRSNSLASFSDPPLPNRTDTTSSSESPVPPRTDPVKANSPTSSSDSPASTRQTTKTDTSIVSTAEAPASVANGHNADTSTTASYSGTVTSVSGGARTASPAAGESVTGASFSGGEPSGGELGKVQTPATATSKTAAATEPGGFSSRVGDTDTTRSEAASFDAIATEARHRQILKTVGSKTTATINVRRETATTTTVGPKTTISTVRPIVTNTSARANTTAANVKPTTTTATAGPSKTTPTAVRPHPDTTPDGAGITTTTTARPATTTTTTGIPTAANIARPSKITTTHVRPNTDTTTTVRPNTDTATTVIPNTDTTTTIRPNTDAANTVRPNTDTATTVRPDTDTTTTVRPNTDAANTVRPNTDTANTVRPNTDAANTVRPSTDTANTVRPNTDATTTVRPNTDTATTGETHQRLGYSTDQPSSKTSQSDPRALAVAVAVNHHQSLQVAAGATTAASSPLVAALPPATDTTGPATATAGVGSTPSAGVGSAGVGSTPSAGVGSAGVGSTPSAGVGSAGVGSTPSAGVGSAGVGSTPSAGVGSAGVGSTPSAGVGSAGVGSTPSAGVGSAGVGSTPSAGVGSAGVGSTPSAGVGSAGVGSTPSAGVGSAGVGSTAGAGFGSTPSAGAGSASVGSTPSAGVGSLPSTGVGSPPGAGVGSPPSTGVGSPPSTGVSSPPSTGVSSPSSTGVSSTPSTGVSSPPGAGVSSPPGAGVSSPPGAVSGTVSVTARPKYAGAENGGESSSGTSVTTSATSSVTTPSTSSAASVAAPGQREHTTSSTSTSTSAQAVTAPSTRQPPAQTGRDTVRTAADAAKQGMGDGPSSSSSSIKVQRVVPAALSPSGETALLAATPAGDRARAADVAPRDVGLPASFRSSEFNPHAPKPTGLGYAVHRPGSVGGTGSDPALPSLGVSYIVHRPVSGLTGSDLALSTREYAVNRPASAVGTGSDPALPTRGLSYSVNRPGSTGVSGSDPAFATRGFNYSVNRPGSTGVSGSDPALPTRGLSYSVNRPGSAGVSGSDPAFPSLAFRDVDTLTGRTLASSYPHIPFEKFRTSSWGVAHTDPPPPVVAASAAAIVAGSGGAGGGGEGGGERIAASDKRGGGGVPGSTNERRRCLSLCRLFREPPLHSGNRFLDGMSRFFRSRMETTLDRARHVGERLWRVGDLFRLAPSGDRVTPVSRGDYSAWAGEGWFSPRARSAGQRRRRRRVG